MITRAFRKARSEDGFTMVELLIVMILGAIMLVGMVGLVTNSFRLFQKSKASEALNDSARRTLSAISRQVKGALHFDNANSSETQLSFWADIDSDNSDSDTTNYDKAEYVRIYLSGSNIVEDVTQPASEEGTQTTATLGAYASDLRFYYFEPGVTPQAGDPPPNRFTGSDINGAVGAIRVKLVLSKTGVMNRTFYQDIFLRILTRKD